ncbi:MAG: elongation factor G [Candidatus Eremiobacterota bacterium]
MKNFETKDIRNVGLYSHGGVGKTSLAEAMLYNAKVIDRLGSVDKGNTVCDFDPDEIQRKMSISSAIAPLEWKGKKINIIDTPGFIDFVGDVIGSLRVVDAGIVLLSAVAGVEVGTEIMWQLMEEHKIPRVILVNGMDKENANFDQSLDKFKELLSEDIIPLQLPIGASESFKGVVDLIKMKAFICSDGQCKEENIPADMKDRVDEIRVALVEKIAENDEELMDKYFSEGELSQEELQTGLRKAFVNCGITPVICASALKNMGVSLIMDLIVETFPTPLEGRPIKGHKPSGEEVEVKCSPEASLSALVYKTMADPFVGKLSYFRVFSGVFNPDCTVYNSTKEKEERITKLYYATGKNQEVAGRIPPGDIAVTAKLQETVTGDTLCTKDNVIILEPIVFPKPVMIMALKAKTKADEDKLTTSLARLVEEDPTLTSERNQETRQLLLSGMGESHLNMVLSRLERKFSVNAELQKPLISYRETIKSRATAEGKHKKQSGGRGQFGHVWLELNPLPKDQHFEFVNKIVGGVVPKNYIPAVEKGVINTMAEGFLAGYPITNIQITIYDGSYHTVDSSDIAFQLAGRLALRKGMEQANPILLEPIMYLEVTVPSDYMGDVMGDLNSKRGRILGMEPAGKKNQVIKAHVPHGEMLNYCIDLRSITQGRGRFKMEFAHYEEVPAMLAEKVIEEAKKAKEES